VFLTAFGSTFFSIFNFFVQPGGRFDKFTDVKWNELFPTGVALATQEDAEVE
jgi:hypothetical protein